MFPASALRCTQWDCRHWILAVPLGLGARWASHLPPLPAATLAGESYASVSQQRPLIPALQSERPTTSHLVSHSSRLGV